MDMVEVYKILNHVYDSPELAELLTLNPLGLRGHSLKLFKYPAQTLVRKQFFSNRVVSFWNKLPEHVVTAPSLATFKKRLYSWFKDNKAAMSS